MKKLIYTTALVLFAFATNAQINWQKGGNNATPPGQPATIGTNATWNSPLGFLTNGVQRLYIDNNAGGVLGNVGIGSSFNPFFRPFSLLHIAQDNNINTAGSIRNWMAPGAPSTYANTTGTGMLISNGDNVWLGLRHKGVWDANDAVLAWGDNGGEGTDYFRFVLNHWNVGGSPGGTNDGMEIMRFDPTSSFVGIGDFMINNQQTPRSKVHIHENIQLQPGGQRQSVWFQMTNEDFAQVPNITGARGLKIGILQQGAANNDIRTANAFIYNQENRHLIFSTNHVTPNGNDAINNTLERMRITSIGAPTTLPIGYGVYNPSATGNTDVTRIAISHNPNNPVTRPLSLLHLGYNAPDANGSATDMSGWRPWMDVGTFTNNPAGILGAGTGISMYTGLKLNPFSSTTGFSSDAVVSWGYTPTTSPTQLKTRMRFLFTTNTTGTTTAAGANGIEAGHFWSDGNNTRMGVGDFMNGTTDLDPDNTLEIKSSTLSPYWSSGNASGLRFTNLISTDAVVLPTTANGINKTKWLTVDINGDVVLSSLTQIGNICGATPTNPLANSWEVIMQNKNYIFKDNELGSVGIGAFGADCTPENTLEIVANANSPYPLTNSSGLRLARLTWVTLNFWG